MHNVMRPELTRLTARRGDRTHRAGAQYAGRGGPTISMAAALAVTAGLRPRRVRCHAAGQTCIGISGLYAINRQHRRHCQPISSAIAMSGGPGGWNRLA